MMHMFFQHFSQKLIYSPCNYTSLSWFILVQGSGEGKQLSDKRLQFCYLGLLRLIQSFALSQVTVVLHKFILCLLGLAHSVLLGTLVYSGTWIDQLKGRRWCWNVGEGCVKLYQIVLILRLFCCFFCFFYNGARICGIK